jgi:hypothetical protein
LVVKLREVVFEEIELVKFWHRFIQKVLFVCFKSVMPIGNVSETALTSASVGD